MWIVVRHSEGPLFSGSTKPNPTDPRPTNHNPNSANPKPTRISNPNLWNSGTVLTCQLD